jgi:heme exporter protein B
VRLVTFLQLIKYDLISAYRRRTDWLNAWLFFVLVVSLFPLAVTPDSNLLHAIAPGLIWVAAMLAMLLSLGNFLKPDYEDGSLALLLLSPHPLSLLLFAKITAFWLVSSLPLIVITPILGLMLHLSWPEIVALIYTLLLGTPVLSLIGAVAMALTVGLPSQNVLLALLILPLCVPVLVFGAGTVINIGMGLSGNGSLALLGAMLILTVTLAPLAAGAALRVGYAE